MKKRYKYTRVRVHVDRKNIHEVFITEDLKEDKLLKRIKTGDGNIFLEFKNEVGKMYGWTIDLRDFKGKVLQ